MICSKNFPTVLWAEQGVLAMCVPHLVPKRDPASVCTCLVGSIARVVPCLFIAGVFWGEFSWASIDLGEAFFWIPGLINSATSATVLAAFAILFNPYLPCSLC
jgi:hypothetical protein